MSRIMTAISLWLVTAIAPVAAPASAGPAAEAQFQAVKTCATADPKAEGLSGVAWADGLHVIGHDGASIYKINPADCALSSAYEHREKTTSVEGLAAGVDGTLWIAGTGAQEADRDKIRALRVNHGKEPSAYPLAFPAQAELETEALTVDLVGNIIVLARDSGGHSFVLSTETPPIPGEPTPLRLIAQLDIATFLPKGMSPGHARVTGAAVSPDGTHLAVRTPGVGLEWDVPNADVSSIRTSGPRTFELPEETGRGITYGATSDRLYVIGGAPVTIHEISVTRRQASADAFSSNGRGFLTWGIWTLTLSVTALAALGGGCLAVQGFASRRPS